MKEADIRPAEIFERYLELSAQDAERCFAGVDTHAIACPACGAQAARAAFSKHGFAYQQCDECRTLYQSPRPAVSAFADFYRDSESSKYWAEVFFPSVAESRRERIFKPRVEFLSDLCERRGLDPRVVIDAGAGYGMFLEEWGRCHPQSRLVAIEPSSHLAEVCRDKGLEVSEHVAEEAQGYEDSADLLTCFEVLEHVHEPLVFLQSLKRLVRPGGYLLVSTLGVDGFDIQTLWSESKSVSPPHHINFMSVAGFETLFRRAGFEDIEVLTPGKLDVDIVRNAWKENPAVLAGNRFLEKIMLDEELGERFQDFLVENRLSSHVWVFCRKSR